MVNLYDTKWYYKGFSTSFYYLILQDWKRILLSKRLFVSSNVLSKFLNKHKIFHSSLCTLSYSLNICRHEKAFKVPILLKIDAILIQKCNSNLCSIIYYEFWLWKNTLMQCLKINIHNQTRIHLIWMHLHLFLGLT